MMINPSHLKHTEPVMEMLQMPQNEQGKLFAEACFVQ